MNYSEIVAHALAIADRQDAETANAIDFFLTTVENRINTRLKVSKMSVRATIPTIAGQEYYGLPERFGGLRDAEIYNQVGSKDRITLKYLSPEQMNNLVRNSSEFGATLSQIYYTVIANQLQIYPPQDNYVFEVVYYQRVDPLTSANPNNWVSDNEPNLYIFGLLVEISSFVKDATAAALWDGRFKEELEELKLDDEKSRWTGTPLQIRAG